MTDSFYSTSHYLSHNVKVHVSHAANPFFAGDIVRTLITFLHIDPGQPSDPADDADVHADDNNRNDDADDDDETNQSSQENSWSRRISSQFSRSLFLSQLEESERKLIEPSKQSFDTSETFLSGSLQLFGHFSVDDEVVDISKFEKLRQSSIIGGCVAGVPSLKISTNVPKSFFQNLSSNLSYILSSDIGELNHIVLNGVATDSRGPLEAIHPLFVTNQLLMFPSLTLKPGNIKQYYLEFKLPHSLPPSYHSENLSISYDLILNAERLRNISSVPSNISITFPLKIAIGPNSKGLQVVPLFQKEFSLNRKYLQSKLTQRNVLVELDNDVPYEDFSFVSNLKNDVSNITSIREEAELSDDDEIQNRESIFKTEFINTMKTLMNEKSLTTTEQIKSLPNSPLINNQEFTNIDAVISSNSNPFENANLSADLPFISGRECIKQFTSAVTSDGLIGSNSQQNMYLDKDHAYQPIIKKSQLKTQFLVKFKNKFTTRLIFDKPFYKIGDSINLCFDFVNSLPDHKDSLTVSGISVSLESVERFKYEYLLDYQNSIEEMHKQFQENPQQAYKSWKMPSPANGSQYQQMSYEQINDNIYIERELNNTNPTYWKKFTHIHWVKKYSLLSSSFKKFNVNDLFLDYSLTPQFNSDIFRLKYYLSFKFVILEEDGENTHGVYLKNLHHDTNGDLFGVKDSLNGVTLGIKIPLNILASDSDFHNINI
ncbi:hypothetical protein DASC09_013380 [Saccharomycopsis crataegensis]|uniref:Uncharacterized protein n=1 Tax=Saccharomycopsis crataegensis TaxID=43959 RepID=A0AAV5QGW9_9ASCO|nr:hypothetical protein DASC09_013380 [Saccharomycopsis crataegensis]